MTAVHDNDGLLDGGQAAGQVKVPLAGKNAIDGLPAEGRGPAEELSAGPP